MQVFYTKNELSAYVGEARQRGLTLGFVPTMGALHQGHLSLINYSRANSDITIASIFVNPTQFNRLDDLENYPRAIEKDLNLLREVGCNVVFIPSEKEIYPEKDTRVFDFDGIDRVMEGEHRPGHFNGVAQVVSKLFDIVTPHKSFFGQKDFQQVAILKKMVEKLNFNIEIITCPIIRELDGLAMSSRNQRLSPEHRVQAPLIYKALKESVEKSKSLTSAALIKDWVSNEINKSPLFEVEYFDIVDALTLQPIEQISNQKGHIGCIAVWAGKVRLIDNIIYNY
jgi:pantoate--beta-alanine ligase